MTNLPPGTNSDALEKGDIWQIGVDIAVNSELRCRFSFLVSRWRCDRAFNPTLLDGSTYILHL